MKSLIVILLSLFVSTSSLNEAEIRMYEGDNEFVEQTISVENNIHMELAFNGTWDIAASTNNFITEPSISTDQTISTEPITPSEINDATSPSVEHIIQNSEQETENTSKTDYKENQSGAIVENESEIDDYVAESPKHPAESTTAPTEQSSDKNGNKDEPPYEDNDSVTEIKPNKTTPTQPAKCNKHDMFLIETTIDAKYQLYNYVTDVYKCKNCSYTVSESHIEQANVSATTISTAETDVYNALNSLRKSKGLSELWTNSYWNEWAETRARELATLYDHYRPNGSSWTNADGTYFTIGENIASGNACGYDFYTAFLNSPTHYSNMILSDAVGVGIGIYVDENGRTYCAMILVASF